MLLDERLGQHLSSLTHELSSLQTGSRLTRQPANAKHYAMHLPSTNRLKGSCPTMARPRAQNYDERRREILSRSAKLFADHGFTGASTSMIAEVCGVSKALLYHYYSSKEDVLFDLLFYHLQHLVEVVEATIITTGDGRMRLLNIASSLLEAYRGADAEHQVQISSLKLLPKIKQEALRNLERRLVAVASDAILLAVPTIEKDRRLVKATAMSFFAMLNWHYLWFRPGSGLTRDEYAALVTGLILEGTEKAAEFMTTSNKDKSLATKGVARAAAKRSAR